MFWLVLIVGIVVLIGSCKNDDDATTSTLSAPTGTSATLGWHQVAVDWTAVSGASSYTVYWGTSTGISSSSTAITGITDDNYTHTGLDNGTTYYYKVATVDSAGTGSLSDEKSATARGASTVAEGCTALSLTETPAGTWTGMKDDTITSGQYFFSYGGATHSNGCVNDSTFVASIAAYVPSGTLGWKEINTMTSNTSFTRTSHWYADTECTKETGFFATGYDNLSHGDNITIAGWPASGEPDQYVPYGTKDSYTVEAYCLLAETDAAKSFISTTYYQTVTVGTPKTIAGEGTDVCALVVNLDNVSGSTKNWLNFRSHDNTTYPDNWTKSDGSDGASIMYSL